MAKIPGTTKNYYACHLLDDEKGRRPEISDTLELREGEGWAVCSIKDGWCVVAVNLAPDGHAALDALPAKFSKLAEKADAAITRLAAVRPELVSNFCDQFPEKFGEALTQVTEQLM